MPRFGPLMHLVIVSICAGPHIAANSGASEALPATVSHNTATTHSAELVVTAVSPSAAPAGAPVKIIGDGFSAETQVRFGETLATISDRPDAHTLVVIVPAGGPGHESIQVEERGLKSSVHFLRTSSDQGEFAAALTQVCKGQPYLDGTGQTFEGSKDCMPYPGPNTIAAGMLQAGSVDPAKLTPASITTDAIADASVTAAKLAQAAVTRNAIGLGVVTEAKFAPGAVTSQILLDDAITSSKIRDGSIMDADLASDIIIPESKLAPIFTPGKVDGAALLGPVIAGTIGIDTTGKLATSGSLQLRADSGVSGRILFGTEHQVGFKAPASSDNDVQWHLPDHDGADRTVLSTDGSGGLSWRVLGSVGYLDAGIAKGNVVQLVADETLPELDGSRLTNLILDADHVVVAGKYISDQDLASAAVATDQLQANAVTSGKIAPRAVTRADMTDGSVDSSLLLDQTIASSDFAPNAITQDLITDAAIDTTKLANGAVTSDKIADHQIVGSHFAESAVQGEHINAQSITSDQLAPQAVTTADFFAGSIGTAKLATGSVTSDKMLDHSIDARHLSPLAVDNHALADGAVTTAKIVDDSVTQEKFAAASITESKLVDAAVTSEKITANGVAAGDIAPNAVGSAEILDSAVLGEDINLTTTLTVQSLAVNAPAGANLAGNSGLSAISWFELASQGSHRVSLSAPSSLASNHIWALPPDDIPFGVLATDGAGTLNWVTSITPVGPAGGTLSGSDFTTPTLAVGSVTSAKIAAQTIVSSDIANSAVATAELADNAVTSAKIGDKTLVAANFASHAISSLKLLDNAVTSAKIANSSVTASDIASQAITTEKIIDHAVTSTQIANDSIISGNFMPHVLETQHFASGAVQANHIMPEVITSTELASNSIGNSELAPNAVNSAKILDSAITAADIAMSAITNNNLASDSVNSETISDRTITAENIQEAAITPQLIANDAITTDHIAPSSLVASDFQDDSIRSSKIADNSIVGADIASTAALTIASISTQEQAGIIAGSNSGQTSRLAFYELSDNGSNFVALKAPDSLAANVIWTLPNSDVGSAVLMRSSTGPQLTWTVAVPPNGPAGGDLTGTYPNPSLKPDAINNTHLTDNSTGLAEMADNAVGSAEVIDQSIVGSDIATNASLQSRNLELTPTSPTHAGMMIKSGELRFRESNSGTTIIALKAPSTLNQNLSLTLPSEPSTNPGSVLGWITGSNRLSWISEISPGGTASGDLAGTYPSPNLATTGVGAGTYPKLTVNLRGRITEATSTIDSSVIPDAIITSAHLAETAAIATSKISGSVLSIANHGLGSMALLSLVSRDNLVDASISGLDMTEIINQNISTTAGIGSSKFSGAVTSIAGHGLTRLATLNKVNSGTISISTISNNKIAATAAIATSKLSGSVFGITSHGIVGSLAQLDFVSASNILNSAVTTNDLGSLDGFRLNPVADKSCSIPSNQNYLWFNTSGNLMTCLGSNLATVARKPLDYHYMFATRDSFTGNLGGVAGADDICRRAARNANLPDVTWKSVIRSPIVGFEPRIVITKPVYNFATPRQKIANGYSDFWSPTHLALVNYDEYGQQIDSAPYRVWTGATSSFAVTDLFKASQYHCNEWTNSATGSGAIGLLNSTGERDWIRNYNGFDTYYQRSCTETKRLYCISQD